MSFSTPTTKEEMYAILKDIFYHHRIKREPYDGVQLDPIELERMTFEPSDEEQLRAIAIEELSAKHAEERREIIKQIDTKHDIAVKTLENLPNVKTAKIEVLEKAHEQSLKKLKAEAVKTGIVGSSVYFDKLTELETDKNQKLLEIENDYQLKTVELTEEIELYDENVQEAHLYRDTIEQLEINAKLTELKLKQEQTEREVFRYNNALDEKEQRYSNTIKQTNASLLLKFMSLRQGEFTKDELVEMGYYSDVLDCVCGYYDTLEPIVAAREISADKTACIYLDHYYESIVYMYTQRALN